MNICLALVFSRVWQELGIGEVIKKVAARRQLDFEVERAVFLIVLYRLFFPWLRSGSGKEARGLLGPPHRIASAASASHGRIGFPSRIGRCIFPPLDLPVI